MSNQFFPTLHTSSWKLTRTPQWQTQVQTSVPGDRKRNPLQTKPLWKWTLKNGVLQSAYGDLQAIQDLFTAMHGSLDWFLWKDPEGDSIVDPSVQINILGDYYWPVAFTSDSLDFDRFAFELWECGTLAFEQVKLPAAVFGANQYPHGSIVSATLSLLSSHTQGDGTGVLIGHNQLGLFDRGWFAGTGDWTLRTDTIAYTSPTVTGLAEIISFNTAFPAALTTPEEFRLYDCWIDVVYQDSTTATLRPQSYAVLDTAQGMITNPANAADSNPSTYADLLKTSISTIDLSPAMKVYGFQ